MAFYLDAFALDRFTKRKKETKKKNKERKRNSESAKAAQEPFSVDEAFDAPAPAVYLLTTSVPFMMAE